MNVREWLLAREPRPPAALSARLAEVLGADAERDATDACDVMIGASEQLVEQLLGNGATTRDSALDLLVADSLVTYAFEAASERPETIEACARDSMRRIAASAQRFA